LRVLARPRHLVRCRAADVVRRHCVPTARAPELETAALTGERRITAPGDGDTPDGAALHARARMRVWSARRAPPGRKHLGRTVMGPAVPCPEIPHGPLRGISAKEDGLAARRIECHRDLSATCRPGTRVAHPSPGTARVTLV